MKKTKFEKIGETDNEMIYRVTNYKKAGEFEEIMKIPKSFILFMENRRKNESNN